jgi:quercetin dioxygenase-like cupin family protein
VTQGTAFELRVTVIPPGGQADYREADWRDALVLVESGEVELECEGGSRERFGHGELVCLAQLPLRALHNHGHEPARLVAVSRSP